jgi:membrane protein
MTNPLSRFLHAHPLLRAFIEKYMKDNVGMLTSVLAWTLLTSIVPLVVGLLAICGFVLQDPATRAQVVEHLSQALQGALGRQEIAGLATVVVRNHGLFAVIGVIGVLWGASNVGGALSTVFQPIFQVRGRNFFKEKLIDLGMFFVFAALMLVIVASTTASALLDRLVARATFGLGTLIVGTIVSLVAAFVLFALIYIVFPNAEPRFKLRNVWPGATVAAVLFQLLTYIFPLYARLSHFQKYGAVLFPILLLTAWIYFFSIILLIGAEIVSFEALRQARAEGQRVGPPPDGTVPQRMDTGSNTAAVP